MRRPSRLAAIAVAVLAVALAFVAARRDAPHALASTVPAAGSTVPRAPTDVELSFTAPVVAARSHVAVHDRAGSALQVGGPRLVVPDRLVQPVSAAVAGEVTVAYHVTFVDGRELAGTLRFTARSGTTSGGPQAGSAHQHGIDPLSAVLLVADGIVVLTVVVLLLRRPRRPRAAGG